MIKFICVGQVSFICFTLRLQRYIKACRVPLGVCGRIGKLRAERHV